METTLTLADKSGVADARRRAVQMAQSLGLPEKSQADAALIVTEAATNILKYAGHGEIVLKSADGGAGGLDVVALDRGPGIANLGAACSDGFSTGGSLGAGLGTIARHSVLFDIYSVAGNGTALFARVADKPAAKLSRFQVGARSTPKLGQDVNGDAWAVRHLADSMWVTLLDGLGHGPLAAEASRRAVDVFMAADPVGLPADVMRDVHSGIKATRGAVMAIAKFEPASAVLSFAGIGNIVSVVHTGESAQHLLSMDGTVGYNVRAVRPGEARWVPGSVFIATTDGLSTRWNLNRHPGLTHRHPSLIASVLHRDFARDADDATVVVVKAV
ncbi:ATP-binding protein [Paraburkholderia strydomiana]|uniref:Anti-sigma regulatory factor (Ser/Thr protein kinase) n=1 Tax=Paraburkholderia caledonica TaxID=134536 RepID=A0ABU1KXD4_9BURK|nr:SpoIIE family protein phosphatase [Paraburkholderia caledonica]MDR6375604.1 anti-sigma regulatory factor (Ser/Thr protein kinase) [Paraburkholderia caledonica]